MNIADAATRDARAAEGRERLEDKLLALYASVEPRSDFGLLHGELCAGHTLVGHLASPFGGEACVPYSARHDGCSVYGIRMIDFLIWKK
jgi:hypothetical protein